ncbi:MAG: DUF2933 domain-containing protein [Candidatus Micrarchaeota archaeon]
MDLSWNSLKNNHMLLMVLCCLIPLVLIFGASYFGLNLRNYSWLILLLCPLFMMWMMKDMHGGHAGHGGNAANGIDAGHESQTGNEADAGQKSHAGNLADGEGSQAYAKNGARAGMKNELPAKKAACH